VLTGLINPLFVPHPGVTVETEELTADTCWHGTKYVTTQARQVVQDCLPGTGSTLLVRLPHDAL
jgi:hypothetical protein